MWKNLLIIYTLLAFVACSDSDLYYDTDQKHTIYFNKPETDVERDYTTFSFAFYSIQDTIIDIPVKYIGMPVDKEQTFKVKLVTDTIGPAAVENTDFEFISLTFPPNQIEANLKIKLNRSEVLKDTTYAISLVFEENEIFTPKHQTFFKLQVSDGELPKPNWWDMSTRYQYNRVLGIYHPAKYRMLLEYFKNTRNTYPDFYKYSVEKLGEFLNEVSEDDRSFFFKKYSSIWGKQVFEPVWEYFTNPATMIPGDDISKMDSPTYLYK